MVRQTLLGVSNFSINVDPTTLSALPANNPSDIVTQLYRYTVPQLQVPVREFLNPPHQSPTTMPNMQRTKHVTSLRQNRLSHPRHASVDINGESMGDGGVKRSAQTAVQRVPADSQCRNNCSEDNEAGSHSDMISVDMEMTDVTPEATQKGACNTQREEYEEAAEMIISRTATSAEREAFSIDDMAYLLHCGGQPS